MNFLKGTFIHIPKTGGKTIKDTLTPHFVRRCGRHHTALSVLSQYPEMKVFPVVTSIRNPWERVWSLFVYTQKIKIHNKTFDEWLETPILNGEFRHFDDISKLNRNPLSLKTWVCEENGQELVTDYIDFYNMQNDIQELSNKYNIKVNFRRHRHNTDGSGFGYRENYTDSQRDYISKVCSWEIEKFKFTF